MQLKCFVFVFTVPQNEYLLCLALLHGHTEGDMPQHEPLGDHFLPSSEFSLVKMSVPDALHAALSPSASFNLLVPL